jgi:hypothetical protein
MKKQEGNIFKEFGYINDYSKWDDTINEKAQHFHELYRVYPNILIACAATFDNIDNYLKQHPGNLVFSGSGEPPPFEGLSTFTATDYELEFCLAVDQTEHYFILVYDETPDFDGKEEPESDNQEPYYRYGMTG